MVSTVVKKNAVVVTYNRMNVIITGSHGPPYSNWTPIPPLDPVLHFVSKNCHFIPLHLFHSKFGTLQI